MTLDAGELLLLEHGNISALPILHYNMEMAVITRQAFLDLQPDCVAVELPESLQDTILDGIARLPDISLVGSKEGKGHQEYLMIEPADALCEGLRSALETGAAAHCIDLAVDGYPDHYDPLPDPYAITRIGHRHYYEAYDREVLSLDHPRSELDTQREQHMARRLKELSLRYDRILFIGGMYHVHNVLALSVQSSFPSYEHAPRFEVELSTVTEESCREVMAECGWFSMAYEVSRHEAETISSLDRQQLLLDLYKLAGEQYTEEHGVDFPAYNLRNIMKYVRNYALIRGKLMPSLFQLLTAAKGCVSHNYAREVWLLATEYPLLRNIDNLPALNLSVEEVWGHSKVMRFHLTHRSRKERNFKSRREKGRSNYRFQPPGAFTICSYPPEDVAVENFGEFLKKKGRQILTEEGAKTVPFTTSLEDGIDTRETIRHWTEKQLYVKARGRPAAAVGSVVIVFDSDDTEGGRDQQYPWCTTWLGEHEQESDMALYATPMGQEVVGPGICRCTYGGFMMSYPPRRMFDVWQDPDYFHCTSKPEVLLTAAIDYAVDPVVVYVAAEPPAAKIKRFARAFGKKIVYIPLGQLSSVTLARLRRFHVLEGKDRRDGADEYIE